MVSDEDGRAGARHGAGAARRTARPRRLAGICDLDAPRRRCARPATSPPGALARRPRAAADARGSSRAYGTLVAGDDGGLLLRSTDRTRVSDAGRTWRPLCRGHALPSGPTPHTETRHEDEPHLPHLAEARAADGVPPPAARPGGLRRRAPAGGRGDFVDENLEQVTCRTTPTWSAISVMLTCQLPRAFEIADALPGARRAGRSSAASPSCCTPRRWRRHADTVFLGEAEGRIAGRSSTISQTGRAQAGLRLHERPARHRAGRARRGARS